MRKLIPLAFLAISFAYIESAVVVYLRAIYYPEGFYFPLVMIAQSHIFQIPCARLQHFRGDAEILLVEWDAEAYVLQATGVRPLDLAMRGVGVADDE